MNLRTSFPEDLPHLARLFHDTVRQVNSAHYTPAEVAAWAPDQPDLERWRHKLAGETVMVAELAGEMVGFCAWTDTGYLDFLYVHQAYQRKGVATALYAVAEATLRVQGLGRIHTQASVTAQPFFLRNGFRLVRHQSVQVRGVGLPNAIMEKALAD